MYESAHPDIYFEPTTTEGSSNVWLDPAQPISADTELLPFRKSAGGFWTTRDARSTETFGYTYFEPQLAAQTDVLAKATIAKKYSSSARRLLTAQPATAGGLRLLNDDRTFTDWAIKTRASAGKLPPTFIIRFLFDVSDRVAEVGKWVRLMPSDHLQTAEMDQLDSQQQVTGGVSLTSALLDQVQRGKLESLKEVHVVPFLKRVVSCKGTDVS
jgi:tyrosinase